MHPDFNLEILPSNQTSVLKAQDLISVSGFYVVLHRKYDSYLWLYFAPCFMMVLTSWISFAVSFESVPGRLGLLLTLLLMMINMTNTISASIPKSDRICPLITWIFISIVFVILALVEYFIILLTVKFGKVNAEEKRVRKFPLPRL